MMYAGCKYAKDANPSTFMKPNGYTTSSNVVNQLIEKDGLDSFEIIAINTECDGLHPYDFETKFLVENDCANSKQWFNFHNNSNMPPAYGTPAFEKYIIEKYGVTNAQFSDEIKKRSKQTCQEKWGVDNPFQAEENKKKMKETKLKNYGDQNFNNREKCRETKFKNHGDSGFNNREKCVETLMKEYGVVNVCQLEEVKKKKEQTYLERYGATCPAKVPEIMAKTLETNKKNHGGVFNLQTEENREKAKLGLEEYYKRQRENPFICPHCNKAISSKGNYDRWHGNKCKHKK